VKAFSELCQELGVHIVNEKTEGPQKVMVLLGLEINTELMLVKILYDKIIITGSYREYIGIKQKG